MDPLWGVDFRRGHFLVKMWGRIQDFLLGAPTLIGGGANLRHRCFSVKTYVKTKEFGPVGGGAPETFVCRSATEIYAKMKKLGHVWGVWVRTLDLPIRGAKMFEVAGLSHQCKVTVQFSQNEQNRGNRSNRGHLQLLFCT